MKILLLVTGLGVGGAEKVVVSLADQFAVKHQVILVYMTGLALLLPTDPRVTVIGLNINSLYTSLLGFYRFRLLISDFRPDVLHSHMFHANIFARLVRLVTPLKKLISTAHSPNEGGRLRMLAYRLTDSIADFSTNVSNAAVSAFEKSKATPPGRMIPVYNGISASNFSYNIDARNNIRHELKIDNSHYLIVAVGRLHEAKDYPNLIQALVYLRSFGILFNMCIVGNGPLLNKLETMVLSLDLCKCVIFLGTRHDVKDIMSAADLFVLPSAWEGFGLVVAEAMACERVVVATDCGGVREVMGNTGYLVQPNNSKVLASAMYSALCLTAEEKVSKGRDARQRIIDSYSLDTVVENWMTIYSVNFSLSSVC